jgi:WD40 repeat protein
VVSKNGAVEWRHVLKEPGAAFRCLAVQPHTDLLAAGTTDGRVQFFDLLRKKLVAGRSTDRTAVQALAFDRRGKRLAAGTAGGKVYWWRSGKWRPQKPLPAGYPVTALAFLRGAHYLAVGGKAVRLWDLAAGRSVWTVPVEKGPVRVLALRPGGDEMVIGDQGRMVRVLDLRALNRQFKQLGLGLMGLPG